MWLLAFSLVAISKKPCSIYGDNKRHEMQLADSLKNRPQTIGTIGPGIDLIHLLSSSTDEHTFFSSSYVSITGYISLVKHGGAETCNCHSKNKADLDTHIELVASLSDDAKNCMICEINRFNTDTTLQYKKVLKLKGKKVEISGWLFYDAEHKQNAMNTNPNGTFIWRATCWEIHPVCKIELL